jgi:PKD repeat protein
MRKASGILGIVVAALALCVACTLGKPQAPPLTGPSELAQSMSIRATPDSISQDGGSQSSIVITVLDPNGKGIPGLAIRLDMQVNGVVQDFGTLSARTIVTDSNGRASAIYTAPPAPPANAGGSGVLLQIVATITGTNFIAAQSQNVEIRLVPPGVILPLIRFVANFTFSPPGPTQGQAVFFDASTTTDPDGVVVSYSWDFGDGQGATGKTASHTYTQAGTFSVTLTVADGAGRGSSTTKGVAVGAGSPPVNVDFTISPTAPAVAQDITFVATAQSGVPGHSIVRYDWNFGSGGATAQGQIVTKSYDAPGNYTVTLTVTDDIGLTKTVSKPVPVVSASGGLFASFTISPTSPAATQSIDFDGSNSTAPSGISRYDWNFGDPDCHDGISDGCVASGRIVQHTYRLPGTYVARLTITDNQGRTATTTKDVSVK